MSHRYRSRQRRWKRRSRPSMLKRLLPVVCGLGFAAGLQVATVAADNDDSADSSNPTTAQVFGEAAPPDFTRRWYLGGGVGISQLEPRSYIDQLTVGDDQSSGGHLFFGLDLSRWLAAEIYAADLGEAQIDFVGDDVGDIEYQVFGASAVGYLYNSRSGFGIGNRETGLWRREGLSLLGRIGVGGLQNDSNLEYDRDYPAHVSFGAGLEYGFRNGFALRAEYMGFDTDAQYASIGVLKRFGDVKTAGAVTPLPALAPLPAPVAPVVEAPLPVLPEPMAPVLFEFDKSELRANERARIDALVAGLDNTEARFQLGGHTDWIASERYNQGLSMRRANAVRRYLISLGIEAERIAVEAFGETRPIASNETDEGRATNRRVEIDIR